MDREIGLGREFNPSKYGTQRKAIQISLAAFSVVAIYRIIFGVPIWSALISGANAGGAAFLAWVLAREWDPDRNASAYLAQFLAALYALALGNVLLLPSAILIFFSRLLSQISGLRIQNWEVLPSALFITVFAVLTDNPMMIVASGLLFIIDARLPDPLLLSRWLGPALSVIGLAYALVVWPGRIVWASEIERAMMGLIVLLNLWQLAHLGKLRSRTDHGNQRINRLRFRWSVLLPLILVTASHLLGLEDQSAFLPAWAALTARLAPSQIIRPEYA